MLRNFIKIGWRNLVRNQLTSLIHIVGLTLGLAASLSVFHITFHELQFNTFIPDHDRIYRLVGNTTLGEGDENKVGFVPYALPAAIRDEITGIETVAAFHNFEAEVRVVNELGEITVFASRDRDTDPAEIVLAEIQYFDIFQYEWIAGNPGTSLGEPFMVVLSERKARKYFGTAIPGKVLGREIVYGDSLRLTVSGLVRDWDRPTDLTFTDFISFPTISASYLKEYINLNEWNDLWSASQAFVKLNNETSIEGLKKQFADFSKVHFSENFIFKPDLQPLSDLHFDPDYQDNFSRKANLATLIGLIAIAFFILIMAAINYITLSTAQAFQRAKEVGIRKVAGSSRINLIFKFLTETFILATMAATLAIFFTQVALSSFKPFVPAGVPTDLNPYSLLFMGIFIVIITFLAGTYPAMVLTSYNPIVALKGYIFKGTGGNHSLRKTLVIGQFVISMVLILCALLVQRQVNFMRTKDLGFRSDAILTLHLPRKYPEKTPIMHAKLQQLPEVEDMTLQLFEPMGQNYGLDRITWSNGTERSLDAAYKMGDENFIPFYNMRLLVGRNITKSETPKEFVINESFIRALGLAEPSEAIGKQLKWRDSFYPVVGVVADFHQMGMQEKIAPTFITTAVRANDIAIKLNSLNSEQLQGTITKLQEVWMEVYPDSFFSYDFLDDSIARFFETEDKTTQLVNLASLISIVISGLGLYGLTAFTTAQRRKEIGIRKVLGATISSMVRLLSKDLAWLIVLASGIAFPIAWFFMHTWLQQYAYKVGIPWWLFLIASIVALTVTLITTGFQCLIAATANPVKSLRTE